jgi:WD40 repeat protein/tetratricopeptide (TPR) repeat protein
LLLTVTGVSVFSAAQLRAALGESENNLARATEARSDARDKLWASYLEAAQAERKGQGQGRRFRSLAAVRKALQLPVPAGRSLDELRNAAASALALPDLEVLQEWEAYPVGSIGLAFDRALERYARTDRQGNVSVRRVADDVEVARVDGESREADVSISPDGRCIAVHDVGTMRLKVWRLTDPKPTPVHEDDNVARWATAFSPDSQRVLYCHTDSRVSSVTLADRQVTRWPATGTNARNPRFRPDGTQVMFTTEVAGRQTLQVRDLLTGALKASLPEPNAGAAAWHPSGRTIAAGSDREIRLWNATTWKETLVLEGHKAFGIECAFTPEGDLLFSTSNRLLRVWDVQTGHPLFTTPGSWGMYAFSPDGRVPIRVGNQVKLIRPVWQREFRTLRRRTEPRPAGYGGVAHLSPDGRLLATRMGEGSCALVDPASGAELAVISMTATYPVQFEASGGLLTAGNAGLCRWPVRPGPATGGCRVGPPQRLFASPVPTPPGSSADGRVLAIPRNREALLVRRDRPGAPRALGPQEDVRFCAVSPDGRWVATGTFGNTQGIGAKVWDADSGKLVKDLRMSGGCQVGFSPDGKWLLTTGGGGRLWAVGTWEEGPALPLGELASFAFSADGRVLALGGEPGTIQLVDPATGRPYVVLEAPEQSRLLPQCFTPDGSRLISWGAESEELHVWDLRLVRRQLAEIGLDWDAPPLPDLPAEAPRPYPAVAVDAGALAHFAAPPNETPAHCVERCTAILQTDPDDVEAYHFRAHAYERLGRFAEAVADFTEALKHWPEHAHFLGARGTDRARLKQYPEAAADLERSLAIDGNQAEVCNELAWLYATGPEAIRDPRKALPLAERAVKLPRGQATYHNTLGVAYYRNGRYRDAITELEASLKGGGGQSDGFDLYFLAMCHHQLGEMALAKECFGRAARWEEGRKLPAAQKEELREFRAEAEKALGAPP